jgi:hypothetical protein
MLESVIIYVLKAFGQKSLEIFLRTTRELVAVNLVKYKESESWKDHLRIINLAPVNFWLLELVIVPRGGGTGESVGFIYHPSRIGDPFGTKVHNQIPIDPLGGAFLYRDGFYYVPLSDFSVRFANSIRAGKSGEYNAKVKFKTLEAGDSDEFSISVVVVSAMDRKTIFKNEQADDNCEESKKPPARR